jgi:hypothetical protein
MSVNDVADIAGLNRQVSPGSANREDRQELVGVQIVVIALLFFPGEAATLN